MNPQIEEKEHLKCKCCKCWVLKTGFINDKGRLLKSCYKCRERQRLNRQKNKCEHGKRKTRCKDCGGGGLCIHGKRKTRCKDCGGKGICEHNHIRSTCKECGGTSICEHNKVRSKCKECEGASICEHGISKYYCKKCKGNAFCEHGKEKRKCKTCDGSKLCIHELDKACCKQCGDAIKITIRNWLSGYRRVDKKYNRFDPDRYIDTDFLKGLIEDYKTCVYCDCEFQFVTRQNNLCTIERIDNSIGHIKSNCVLACFRCNILRSAKYSYEEFKSIIKQRKK